MSRTRILASLLALALIAACAPDPDPARPDAAPEASNSISLQALTGPDIDANPLSGELACSFAAAGGEMLVIARGNVMPLEHSFALVRHDDNVRQLQSAATGGYDGMVEGALFENGAFSVAIARGARQPDPTEQVVHAATLTVTQDDATRSYEGAWTCGP